MRLRTYLDQLHTTLIRHEDWGEDLHILQAQVEYHARIIEAIRQEHFEHHDYGMANCWSDACKLVALS